LSTSWDTPGAIRLLMACSRQSWSKVARMASVPMTVIGFMRPPATGSMAVASPVGMIWLCSSLLVMIGSLVQT
jgi:hypothetical protein